MLHLLPEIEGKRGVAIAGPTASGKSGLALALAERHGGTIINSDSMQVYRDLSVLTARPGEDELERAPHRLYGHVDGAAEYSAAAWAEEARQEIANARAQGRLPILVGGTGLYFRSLFKGLSEIPAVPAEIRARWRASSDIDSNELHAELARRDPVMAARLRPSDRQRVLRALEVIEATGRSLADWQGEGSAPLEADEGWVRLVLAPDRSVLVGRIAERAATMLTGGGRAEVEALLARRLDPMKPVMKAIGVGEIAALVRGEIDADEALARLVAATRRYAKRQDTWFRTQAPGWTRMAP